MHISAAPPSAGADSPRSRPGRRGRVLTAVVATSVLAPLLAVLPTSPAAAAGYNDLEFADGETWKEFGANGAVIIDGVLAYDDTCAYDTGIKDFFYPATDVYIVEAGSTTSQGKLTDVGGENPNTIVAPTSGIFLDETIGFTAPAGTLDEGEYDVVFDTCQDGFYTAGDTVFEDAIVVSLPETLPSVSPTIAAIKDRAREQYISWLQTHMILTALFSADKAKEIISCILVANPLCALAVLAHLLDEGQIGARQAAQIQDLAAALAMNVAKNHGAIWKDPPDEVFEVLPVLDRPEDGDLPRTGQPLFDAVADLTPALADEAALTDGLLHAIERYQGAQAAGDGDWALAQARAARDLSAALADHLDESAAVEQLRTAVDDGGAALDARLAEGRTFANRVRTAGFTADEEHRLRDLGLSKSEIDGLEGQYVAQGQLLAYDRSHLTAALTTLSSGRSAMADALDASLASWDAVVAQLEGSGPRTLPTADAGGPYTAPAGTPVVLDGGGSSAVPGATITAHDWDLDADGAFDDATGATPSATFRAEGGQLVSLRVTDSAGRSAVTSTRVAVTRGDQPPTITAAAPQAAATATVGSPVTLEVDASDPEGRPLVYRWERDGATLPSDGDSLTWTPTQADVGPHTVNLVVDDGTSRGTARTWRLTVSDVDADGDGWTATTDCDETRSVVNPGLSERLGNGLDDDCSPSTADGPPGGLTGTVWSWGDGFALGDGTTTRRHTPQASPLLPAVVQLQAYLGRGLAVLPDGTLQAWGQNHRGELGLGPDLPSTRRPTPVLGVDSPTLTDVVQVETETMHTVALRKDGTVVAFGNNELGQSGAGDDVARHPRPVEVVTPDGTPLRGVVSVESGMSEQWAVLADGTLRSWGAQNCRGQWPYAKATTASPVPLFGKGVVQVSAGSFVLARKADGSVWACAGDHELLDRTKAPTSPEAATPQQMEHFGPGSGVIDVGAGGDAAVALKADGSVWMWGKNVNGELNVLGVGHDVKVMVPRQVTLPEGAQVVDVEMDGSCTGTAVRADGSVLTWGCNTNGAAGTGTWTDPLPGFAVLSLGGGAAYATASVAHNGFALVRPQDAPPIEPVTPWISLEARDASIGEATGGAVELRLDAPARTAVQVGWALEGGATGTATVPAGASSVSVPVRVQDDTRDEHDQQLAFHVVGVSDGIRTARGIASVTVVDDDAAPTLTVTPLAVDEGGTSLTDAEVEVRLSQASGKDVEVLWSTADGTATSPADFTAAGGHLLLPAGTTTATVNLAVSGDDVPEPSEAFTVVLRDPVDAVVGAATGTVTVRDDEPVRLVVASPTVTETDAGTVPATFTVSAPGLPAGVTVTVPWTVAAGTAEVPADVAAHAGELRLSAAASSGTVVAQVAADELVEVRETFRLDLGAAVASDGRPVVLAEPTVATIVDDDRSQPQEPEQPAYDFDGFFAPVVNLPLVNGMQAGRAVPLKFSLGGDHGLDVFAAGHPASQRITCDSGAAVDAVEETSTAGASSLTYDAATGRYSYVWKTERAWKGQCRRILLRFADGTEASAEFRFS